MTQPIPRDAIVGELGLEYSAFAVDGRPDLAMFVYALVSAEDAKRIRSLTGSAAIDRA